MRIIGTPFVGVFILENGVTVTNEFETVEHFLDTSRTCTYQHAYLLPMSASNPSVWRMVKTETSVESAETVVTNVEDHGVVEEESSCEDLIEQPVPEWNPSPELQEGTTDCGSSITWSTPLPSYQALGMDMAGNIRGFTSIPMRIDVTGNLVMDAHPIETRYGELILAVTRVIHGLVPATGIFAIPANSVVRF